jgi:hypothetical protein
MQIFLKLHKVFIHSCKLYKYLPILMCNSEWTGKRNVLGSVKQLYQKWFSTHKNVLKVSMLSENSLDALYTSKNKIISKSV